MFRLCLALGVDHPDRLLDRLTAPEIADWTVYDKIEPIGGYRTDIMLGTVCSLIVDVVGSLFAKQPKKEATSPIAFIPWLQQDDAMYKEEEKSTESTLEMINRVKAEFGIVDEPGDPKIWMPGDPK